MAALVAGTAAVVPLRAENGMKEVFVGEFRVEPTIYDSNHEAYTHIIYIGWKTIKAIIERFVMKARIDTVVSASRLDKENIGNRDRSRRSI